MTKRIKTDGITFEEVDAVVVVDPVELSDKTIAKLAKAIAEELKK